MRILFTSDLHGDEGLYEQLDALLLRATPDVLILGGDLFVDGAAHDPLGTQVAWVEKHFLPKTDSWRKHRSNLVIACILGNHDWGCTHDVILERARAGEFHFLDIDHPLDLGGLCLIGYSATPPTPFALKDFERLDRAEDPVPVTGGIVWDPQLRRGRAIEAREHFGSHPCIASDLARINGQGGPWGLVCHAPPHDTALDRLPGLRHPVGSVAVRALIESRAPRFALHGHIHESPSLSGRYFERIGETLCINPGQSIGRLHAVHFDLDRPQASIRHTVMT